TVHRGLSRFSRFTAKMGLSPSAVKGTGTYFRPFKGENMCLSPVRERLRAERIMKRKIVFAAILLAIAAMYVAIVQFWPYSEKNYRGDGVISDSGFWSYPRYHIRFSEVSLTAPSQHCFKSAGLPPALLTLTLNLVYKGNNNNPSELATYDELNKLATCVSVTIIDENGDIAYAASGPLRDWVLSWMSAACIGAYWHPDLRDMKLGSKKTYVLKIAVTEIGEDSAAIAVVPIIEGGGNELP
ncbi:MAG: hypothetical protein JW959_10560, partial [Pirellulales bacterium]|nr:hypothetical protein [Pirellulales bacterium]